MLDIMNLSCADVKHRFCYNHSVKKLLAAISLAGAACATQETEPIPADYAMVIDCNRPSEADIAGLAELSGVLGKSEYRLSLISADDSEVVDVSYAADQISVNGSELSGLSPGSVLIELSDAVLVTGILNQGADAYEAADVSVSLLCK